MIIGVIGAGYVGLVTGACLARAGHSVRIVDSDAAKIAILRGGRSPHYEPGLDACLAEGIRAGRLSFGVRIEEAARGAAVALLAVGTPSRPDGTADLSFLWEAVRELAVALDDGAVLVVKSTVPVGTNRRLAELASRTAGRPVKVVSNPEFLREGTAVADCLSPDRVVLGGGDAEALAVVSAMYAGMAGGRAPVMAMDYESAEMVKYASNAYLAARLSFINEFAALCRATGADISAVCRGMGADRRIGPDYLHPGLGYGGSCFPKDLQALSRMAESAGVDAAICRAVVEVNQRQAGWFDPPLDAEWGKDWSGRHIALWGLAFKARTDDVRASPALALARRLMARGVGVAAHDPAAVANAQRELGPSPAIRYADDPYDALPRADALIIATEWEDYRHPDMARIKTLMKTPLILDGRNLLDPAEAARAGFRYESVGRSHPCR